MVADPTLKSGTLSINYEKYLTQQLFSLVGYLKLCAVWHDWQAEPKNRVFRVKFTRRLIHIKEKTGYPTLHQNWTAGKKSTWMKKKKPNAHCKKLKKSIFACNFYSKQNTKTRRINFRFRADINMTLLDILI